MSDDDGLVMVLFLVAAVFAFIAWLAERSGTLCECGHRRDAHGQKSVGALDPPLCECDRFVAARGPARPRGPGGLGSSGVGKRRVGGSANVD